MGVDMSGTCLHGFDPAQCLICRTLGTDARPTATAEVPKNRRGERSGPPSPVGGASPARPDVVYAPSPAGTERPHRSLTGTLLLAAMVLLAIGAAVWILSGVVFTVLHVLELLVVAAAAGWVGYRIGHYKGSRRPRPGD
jgi:hypothetical protein